MYRHLKTLYSVTGVQRISEKYMEKLIISYRNAFFGDNMKDDQHGFDYEEFMELFQFLIDNIYINVFKQIVGIPMGTDCAPHLANLYMFYHEYHLLQNLASSNIIMVNIWPYI